MSLEHGMAALHLDMPPRVPRTEYSIEGHWEALGRITGIEVQADSPPETQMRAQQALWNTWNFDFFWSTLIYNESLGNQRTAMGHAEYAAGGVDYNPEAQCPFQTPEEVLAFDPMVSCDPRDHAQLVRHFEEHYQANCALHPDGVNMTGVYVTCVSGLIEIFGWDMLLFAAGWNPEEFGRLTDRYCAWVMPYFEALAEADVPVVMVHDDIVWTSGPFIHPDWYRDHVFPNYRKFFAPLIDSGKKIIYTSDGNYTMFVDDIAACGVHGFVMEPMTDMAYVAEQYGKTHAFIGNADTRILLSGSREAIRDEVKRCMDIGKHCPGFFMAVGNHIPANTPVENLLYYNACYEEMARR